MVTYIRRYKLQNFKILFLIGLSNTIYVFCSFLGMRLAKVVMDGSLRKMVMLLLLNSTMWSIFSIVEYYRETSIAKTIALMNQGMRAQICENMVKKQYTEYIEKNVGEYISWYTNDIKEADELGFTTFYMSLDAVLKIVVGSVALLLLHWTLLLCTIVVAFLVLAFSKKMHGRVEAGSGKVSQAMERFTNEMREQLTGFTVLKYFGLLTKFCRDNAHSSKNMEETRYSFATLREQSNLVVSFINIVGQFSINLITFGMCALRILPVEVFFGSGNITSMVSNSIQSLAEYRITLSAAKPYFDKTVPTTEPEEKEEAKRESLSEIRRDIILRNLVFSYGDRLVLDHLNMEFQIGGKYALTGKSGCGKSTILKLLIGQLRDYKGEILFDGKNSCDLDENSFYTQMAYIEQNVFLYNTTIRENITLGEEFTEEEMQKALEESALAKDLTAFPERLETVVGDNGSRLSGGQKQRIAIARALIHKRSILLVDEGTSALDQENADLIEESLLRCEGLTLILVSHHLKEGKECMYDRIYKL